MRTSIELRQERARVVETMRGITETAERANRSLSATERSQYDAGDTEFRSLSDRIARAETLEAADADAARSIGDRSLPGNERRSASDQAWSSALGQDFANEWLPSFREYREMHQRALDANNSEVLLPVEQFGQWYDRLRTKSVVLEAGPRTIQIEGHSIDLPGLATSVSIGNYGEGETIAPSQPSFEKITLTPKKFAALVIAGNESVDDSRPDLLDIVATDLLRSVATEIDSQLLRGDGTGETLTGLRNLADVTVGPNLGTNGGVPTLATILDMLTAYEAAGGDPERARFFMTPGIWGVLRAVQDTTNRYQLQPDASSIARKTLFGVNVGVTSNLPSTETKGTSSATSTIILADMSNVVVGIGKGVEIQQSRDRYFETDQTGVRLVTRLDINDVHPETIVVTKGAKVS